jgi:hypothetical protein
MRVSTGRAFARYSHHGTHMEWHGVRFTNPGLLLTTLAALGLTVIYLAVRSGLGSAAM